MQYSAPSATAGQDDPGCTLAALKGSAAHIGSATYEGSAAHVESASHARCRWEFHHNGCHIAIQSPTDAV